MAGLFGDQGEVILLDMLVNKGTYAPEDLVLKLFTNNYTPVDGTTEGSLTEATFTGYSAVTLTGASWTLTPDAPSTAVYSVQTFTSTADQALQYHYGYYLVQSVSGKYVAGERFTDGPYAIVRNTDYIEVTPTIQMKKAGE